MEIRLSVPSGWKKPKMPKFSGDIRDYVIFKADMYNKRDAITLLRASLQGRPLELIKGTGQDYGAAWEYLDSIYGDPRFVADTQDISRFKPLRDGDDARFKYDFGSPCGKKLQHPWGGRQAKC